MREAPWCGKQKQMLTYRCRNVGRTIVITGASDGLGAAAARRLKQDGHRVIIVGRSKAKTESLAKDIGAESATADFCSLADVRRLATQLVQCCPRIDVLANNAGCIVTRREVTEDGFEANFQVNYLAPALLTQLLMKRLVHSRASVIQTSSVAARMLGRIDLADFANDKSFNAMRAYGTAKLGGILYTRELHRRYHAEGLSAAAFHPGAVASNFAADAQGLVRFLGRLTRPFMISPEKGAEQLIWLASASPVSDWVSGAYYERGQPARRNNPQALDDDLARRLWDRTEQLLDGDLRE